MRKIFKYEGWHSYECVMGLDNKILSERPLNTDTCPECGGGIWLGTIFEVLGRWQKAIKLLKNAVRHLLTNPLRAPAMIRKDVRLARISYWGPDYIQDGMKTLFQYPDDDCDHCDAGFFKTGALGVIRCPECGEYGFAVAIFETSTWLERVEFMLNKLNPLNLFSEWRHARNKLLGPEIWEFPWWMLKRICWRISMAQLATPGFTELEVWRAE